MKLQKKLTAKLSFTKQTIAKLNDDAMASMRGGAGIAAAGFNMPIIFGISVVECASTGQPTCNTQGDQGF
jgi:hypothetical protein